MLLIIDLAEVIDIEIKYKERLEKRRESNSKKVYHDPNIIQESVRLDLDYISKIAKSTGKFLDLDLIILKDDILVSVLVFTALQMTKLVQVLWLEVILMYSDNFGYWQPRIKACTR